MKSNAEDFADTLKDERIKIIAWAKREIVEYLKLITILENRNAKQKDTKKPNKASK